jgi:hypothetical protein
VRARCHSEPIPANLGTAAGQSTKIEWVISLQAAKALRLTILQSILIWADEVIQ